MVKIPTYADVFWYSPYSLHTWHQNCPGNGGALHSPTAAAPVQLLPQRWGCSCAVSPTRSEAGPSAIQQCQRLVLAAPCFIRSWAEVFLKLGTAGRALLYTSLWLPYWCSKLLPGRPCGSTVAGWWFLASERTGPWTAFRAGAQAGAGTPGWGQQKWVYTCHPDWQDPRTWPSCLPVWSSYYFEASCQSWENLRQIPEARKWTWPSMAHQEPKCHSHQQQTQQWCAVRVSSE